MIKTHFFLALILVPGVALADSVETAARPNVVVILADDMGYGDCTANNRDSKISTPNMDRLANEGIRFTDAHSGGSSCIPSRYCGGLRSAEWHYMKYGEKGEELYDMIKDPDQYTKRRFRPEVRGRPRTGKNTIQSPNGIRPIGEQPLPQSWPQGDARIPEERIANADQRAGEAPNLLAKAP